MFINGYNADVLTELCTEGRNKNQFCWQLSGYNIIAMKYEFHSKGHVLSLIIILY